MFVLNYCEKVFKKLLPTSMTYKSEEEHILLQKSFYFEKAILF